MSSRPFKHHKPETLAHLLELPDTQIGRPVKRQIEREQRIREQLAALENGQEPDQEEFESRKAQARGTRPEDRMNKTEARYARKLDADPFVRRWWFEHFKLRVGVERDWFTVDFMVETTAGELEFHEVKGGHVREDAIEKFKAAALLYPMWPWVMVQQSGKGKPWETIYEYDPHTTQEEE